MDSSITVDRLFRSTKCVELGEQKIAIHALSDLELQERHRRALEASMRHARQLRDPNSGEYLSTLEPVATAEKSVMVAVCVAAKRRFLADDAERELPFTHIPFPDNATTEEQAKTLEEREAAQKALGEKRSAWVEDRLKSYQSELEAADVDRLRPEAIKLTSDLAREAAYSEEYVAQSIHLGTDGHFGGVEQVRRLARPVINLLWQAQEEVTNLDPLGLKSRSLTA